MVKFYFSNRLQIETEICLSKTVCYGVREYLGFSSRSIQFRGKNDGISRGGRVWTWWYSLQWTNGIIQWLTRQNGQLARTWVSVLCMNLSLSEGCVRGQDSFTMIINRMAKLLSTGWPEPSNGRIFILIVTKRGISW